MKLSEVRFPRQLETDHDPEAVRRVLMAATVRLWPGGSLDVPRLPMSDPLKKTLRTPRVRRSLRCGFDAISDRMRNEKAGIAGVREQGDAPYGERVSRLILFSNDGAERLYRHIERLLESHAPRVLGCLLDVDALTLGEAIAGKESRIKIVMAEHKDAVSELLRAIVAGARDVSPGREKDARSGGEKNTPTVD